MHPVDIKFQGLDASEAVEAFARAWAAKLDRIYGRIDRCEVVIGRPHHHHRHGGRFHVRIVLGVPGPDIVAVRGPADNRAHENVYVAVRDAFRAARRQLQDRVLAAAA